MAQIIYRQYEEILFAAAINGPTTVNEAVDLAISVGARLRPKGYKMSFLIADREEAVKAQLAPSMRRAGNTNNYAQGVTPFERLADRSYILSRDAYGKTFKEYMSLFPTNQGANGDVSEDSKIISSASSCHVAGLDRVAAILGGTKTIMSVMAARSMLQNKVSTEDLDAILPETLATELIAVHERGVALLDPSGSRISRIDGLPAILTLNTAVFVAIGQVHRTGCLPAWICESGNQEYVYRGTAAMEVCDENGDVVDQAWSSMRSAILYYEGEAALARVPMEVRKALKNGTPRDFFKPYAGLAQVASCFCEIVREEQGGSRE